MNTDRELIQSVIETLRQGEILLAEIPDESYTRKVVIAFNASIGGHYRHCLDHFNTLFEAATAGDLNYSSRKTVSPRSMRPANYVRALKS